MASSPRIRPLHRASCSRLLFALILAAASAASLARAQCTDEECLAEPILGNPDRRPPPIPTPRNQKPDIDVLGSGLVEEINCGNPGTSDSELSECPAGNSTADVTLKNNGRIVVQVAFILPDGQLENQFKLRPGQEQPLANQTCVGHRWMVQSLCGECMAVVRVADTAPELVLVSNEGIEAVCPGPIGQWSPVRQWQNDVVAAGLANVPGSNRVLGFSSVQEGSYKRREPLLSPLPPSKTTQVEIYDYDADTFTEKDLLGHNMFCAALTMLPDGKLFAQGGGDGADAKFVSTFDPFDGPDGSWTRHNDTNNGHWYGTVVVTKEQSLLLALGVDKADVGFKNWERFLDFPEISQGFDFSLPWLNMTGVDMDGKQPDNLHWYPVMHLMPNGDILESGTMNDMWKIDTTGQGTITSAGKRNKQREESEAWGASTIMFDEGKLLTVGGIENWVNNRSPGRFVYQRGIVIDMNDPNNISTFQTKDLAYSRAFPNTVVLPSGEVLAVGGKDNTKQWDDTFSIRTPELWNPITDKWKALAEHQAPRNYHSAAILLRDGRVMSAGGGLCGSCNEEDENGNKLNQPTHEILSPPYLFDDVTGALKPRPVILRSSAIARPNRAIRLVVTGERAAFITRVSVVKQSSVTHTITTDARQLELKIFATIRRSDTKYVYKVRALSNVNVMTPGYWFLFALDDTGTPSIARDLKMVLA